MDENNKIESVLQDSGLVYLWSKLKQMFMTRPEISDEGEEIEINDDPFVTKSEIQNELNSEYIDRPLSADAGRRLNEKIPTVTDEYSETSHDAMSGVAVAEAVSKSTSNTTKNILVNPEDTSDCNIWLEV